MGTNNFLNLNANNIYSFWLNYSEDENDYDFFQDDLKDKQQEIIEGIRRQWVEIVDEDERENHNRNFEWKIFASIILNDFVKEKWEEVEKWVIINLICRNWYYEWVNFDYNFQDLINYYNDFDYDLLNKRLQKKFDKTIKIIENIYWELLLWLKKVWQFSNWEAVYEKA